MKRYKGIVCGAVLAVLLAGGCLPAPAPAPDAQPGSPSASVTQASLSGSSPADKSGTKALPSRTGNTVASSAASNASLEDGARSTASHTRRPEGASTTSARPSPPVSASTRSKTTAVPRDGKITVTFSVDCSTAVAAGNETAQAISSDGIILKPMSIVLEEGATPFDALQKSGLVVSYSRDVFGVFIKSIQSLAVNACGSESGWLYSVNGTYPGRSCSKYTLKDGDVVCWRYTCENGADV